MEYGKQAIGSMGHVFAWSKSGNGEIYGYVLQPEMVRRGAGGYYRTDNPAEAAAVAEALLLAELAAEAPAADGSKVNRRKLVLYYHAARYRGYASYLSGKSAAVAASGSKVNRRRLSRFWYAAWNNGHTRKQVEAGTAAMLEGDIGAVELAAERAEYWLQWALYWLALAMGATTRRAPWATQGSNGTGGR